MRVVLKKCLSAKNIDIYTGSSVPRYVMVARKLLTETILLIFILTLFLIPLPVGNLWWRELFNSGHTFLFIFISLGLYSSLNAACKISNTLILHLVVLMGGLFIGGIIELLQGLVGREPSAVDLSRDLFGIIAGSIAIVFMRQKMLINRMLLSLAMLICIGLGSYSLIQISWHYVLRSRAFPMIVGFDESWSNSFVRYNNSEFQGLSVIQSRDGDKRYKIKFDSGKYPGVSMIEPEKDWSDYRELRFKVYSENAQEVSLVLRVHDAQHNQNYKDRFNRKYIIQPGINEIIVELIDIMDAPIGRKLDLSDVAGVQFYLKDNNAPIFLEIGNIFLES